VAYGRFGERTAADLLRDAAAVAHALPEKTAERPLALLGVRRDLYACCAALLGAWERGYELLVPAADTTRKGFLRLAQRPDVAAVLHDTASSAALPIASILARAQPDQRLPDARCVLQGVLHLAASEAQSDLPTLRVSGAQLLSEAALLGRSLGLPERGRYASTLLPSTRYAWAAGVFWPLLSGSALLRDDPRQLAWAEQLERSVLIGAPAHIRTLARGASASLASAQQVVSLGAPLPAAAFSRLRELGLAVSDVYATRELGCLGWRYAADRPFRPLLEVFAQATPDRAFQVSAPHTARAARINAIPTSDGGFIATGVGVQRADWEERIAWLDGVHDAALLRSEPGEPLDSPRPRESDPEYSFLEPVQPAPARKSGWFVTHSADASATRTGATATSVQAYCVAITVDGPARDAKALQARVLAELPALEIAQWRSLQRRDEPAVAAASFASGRCDLTRNGAGRHDRVSLLRLFGRDADSAPLSWQLTIEREQDHVREVRVPERYGYFNGHFPGYPLLPGAAQLSELVVPFVRAMQPELGRLTRMARLKFQERIVPNDLIEVSLTFAADSVGTERSVEFALRRGASVCASGRLWFAAGAA
jgi:3-hydroxymyristoyl/3-hydroxydecanoyl-(acyl carrier protein) dehydratase